MPNNTAALKNREEKTAKLYWVIAAVLSVFPLYAVHQYLNEYEGISYKTGLLNLLLYLGAVVLLRKALAITDRRLRKLSLGSALLFSVMLVLGHCIYSENSLAHFARGENAGLRHTFMFAGFVLLFYSVLVTAFHFLENRELRSPSQNQFRWFGANKRSLLLTWGIVFLCWLPCFLSYYPGVFSYDVVDQTYQSLGIFDFNNFHPAAHTFFLKICISIGRFFGGAAAQLATYSVLQMLLLSFVFATAVWYLARLGMHYRLRLIALLYFALNPINAIFSFVPTKDVLFTAFFLLTTLLVIEIVRDPGKIFAGYKGQALFAFSCLLFCLFRNNGIFALLLFFPCFMVLYKKYKFAILRMGMAVVVSFLLLSGPIFTLLGVGPGNGKEALCVPMQQIASIAANHTDALSAEEKETIAEILDFENLADAYNPRFADPVKNNFNMDAFSKDPVKYMKLWGSLLLRYPMEYADSFLSLNIGYWYPDAVQPDPYANRIYIETYINEMEQFPIQRQSLLPGLLSVYEGVAEGSALQKIPVFSLLFSIGFPIWFVLTAILLCIVKRKRKLIAVFLPAFFMWFTFMAGPVSNLRYIYPIIAAYPVYLAVLAQSKRIAPDKQPENDTNLSEFSQNIGG